MSIAGKITSIETHISDDYEGLVNLGADLTGINKNIQNIKTVLDTVWNNLPKVSNEGTEVTLTPTLKGKLGIVEKGNSTQESTTGKNLLQITATSTTSNNVTFTVNNDGTVTVKTGTGGASANTNFFLNNSLSLETNNYTVTGCPSRWKYKLLCNKCKEGYFVGVL